MTATGPGSGDDDRREPDGTPSVPEYVWRLFLEDDERAIRASAPREPAARDRFPGGLPEPSAERPGRSGTDDHPGASGRPDPSDRPDPSGRPEPRDRPGPVETVGEAWCPEDAWAGPGRREPDGRSRGRRFARVFGTAAALAVVLGAWSQLSTGPATPGGNPAETIGQRLEESPALPTPGSVVPRASLDPDTDSLAPTVSGAASPAVFDAAPSATSGTTGSPGTVGSPGTIG
ncbi:hypothetical protein [Streptomyces sp. NPDC048224]|uniref:hypothetical protein n=1 Tax=Streptomyces sp. NPDC048224 TaxID=3154500 RepID=UPI0033CBAE79